MYMLSFYMDNLVEMIRPVVLIVAFITLIYIVVNLILDNIKEFRKLNYCEELGEDDEGDIIQKAIITIGNEKIEIEVEDYDIEDTIIKIEAKGEKLYLTDTKNVLLISD